MTNHQQTTSASAQRKPGASAVQDQPTTQRAYVKTAKPYLVAKPDVRLPLKLRLSRLPHEGEDAKLTGMTRSLNRRLLGLNVGGSLPRGKIA